VRKILSVRAKVKNHLETEYGLHPYNYHCTYDLSSLEDRLCFLEVASSAGLVRGEGALLVKYVAGYDTGEAPGDLASACLELADWNMTRCRSRRIGIAGQVRGKGGCLEASMPENVRMLLEPYRRRMI
jgi:hypothetical protein